jgi:hypothetical protein
MGYKAYIDAITTLLGSFHFSKKCLQEISRTGTYTGMSFQENIDAQQQIEGLVGPARRARAIPAQSKPMLSPAAS